MWGCHFLLPRPGPDRRGTPLRPTRTAASLDESTLAPAHPVGNAARKQWVEERRREICCR